MELSEESGSFSYIGYAYGDLFEFRVVCVHALSELCLLSLYGERCGEKAESRSLSVEFQANHKFSVSNISGVSKPASTARNLNL